MHFKVGLLGHGTVGKAFCKLLQQRAEAIAAATGRKPELVGVLTRSQGNFADLLKQADVIVEVIGGIEPARTYVLEALRAGKHVVTANKQLLSQHGEELWAVARERGVQLRFEPSVAGAVPAVRVLQDALAGAYIERIHGIVNGTTNYILTAMERTGVSYKEALADAQRRGYAEADPTDDVSGADAAAKMAILARLAFGTPVRLSQVTYEGIEHITPDELEYARELDLGLKLVGTAERVGEGISVRVHPVFLYKDHPLASVHGSFNAVTIESSAINEITLSGPGAGGIETASAVLGDVVSTMTERSPTPQPTTSLPIVQDFTSAFYLHLEVADRQGILVNVTKVLADHDISVKAVYQKGNNDHARLIMVTHPTLESKFYQAVKLLKGADFLHANPRTVRVIEEEFIEGDR